MNAIPIDTHKAIKQLKDSGVEEKQAEALVELMSSLLTEKLATKHDIKELYSHSRNDFSDIKADIRDMASGIKDMKSDIKIMSKSFKHLETNFDEIKSDNKAIAQNFKQLETDNHSLKNDMDWIKRILFAIGITIFIAAFKYIFIE